MGEFRRISFKGGKAVKRSLVFLLFLLWGQSGFAEERLYLWAECSTSFQKGIDGREVNIVAAAEKLNGFFFRSGEEFSFNERISSSFSEGDLAFASTISGGKRVQAEGGGLCQVSSTLYCAALRAGFSIRERRAHSSSVTYLGPGLDATVSIDEGIDLKFLNPYGPTVFVRSRVVNGVLSIALVSRAPAPRKISVLVEGPYRCGESFFTTTSRIICDRITGKELFREVVSRDTYQKIF